MFDPARFLGIGHQHDLLALAPSGTATAAWALSGHSAAAIFSTTASDTASPPILAKRLKPAADGDEAFLVDRDDVAGIVPAVLGRHDLARRIGLDIAQHDIGPAHMKLGRRRLMPSTGSSLASMPAIIRPTVPG